MSQRRKRVAIIHPDLGIGGAEQLIINVALALQHEGYQVRVFTPHFDPNHCFAEALKLDIEVRGAWFPRSISGRMIAFCAYIRMLLCSLYLVLCGQTFDYYVIDQVSFPIPLLRLRNRNVLFYCHFPDKLLSTERTTCLKKAYRLVLDFVEEVTTAMARCIVVNSQFTLKVFQDNFPLIHNYFRNQVPQILYPSIQEKSFNKSKDFNQTIQQLLDIDKDLTKTHIITSLNRYERKKNINLAIESFATFKQNHPQEEAILVVAGGYDPRLPENVEHYDELVQAAKDFKIEKEVVFLRSISNDQRLLLLENTKVLLYTPSNEHFGIVPVEAMYMGCIVIACNSGGPLESISHDKTGFLLSPNSFDWGDQIGKVIKFTEEQRSKMLEAAKERVESMFTFKVFSQQLDTILKGMDH